MNLVQLKPLEKEDVFYQNFVDSYFNVGQYTKDNRSKSNTKKKYRGAATGIPHR